MAYPLLIDMAIHQFDLARDLIGAEPVAVVLRVVQPGLELVRRETAAAAGQLRVRRPAPASRSPAAGAVRAWRRPGTAAGESAELAARRRGTETTNPWPRPPTAHRLARRDRHRARSRSPARWPSSSAALRTGDYSVGRGAQQRAEPGHGRGRHPVSQRGTPGDDRRRCSKMHTQTPLARARRPEVRRCAGAVAFGARGRSVTRGRDHMRAQMLSGERR